MCKNDFLEFKDDFGGDVNYKIDFLKRVIAVGYNEKSAKQAIALFKISKGLEEDFEKDIYDFNQSELEVLLMTFSSPTVNALQAIKSIMDKYLLNAVDEKKSKFSVSPTLSIRRSKLKDLIFKDAQHKRLCTIKEFYDAIDLIANYQDKALLICIWHGFYNKGYQMIRDAKNNCVNFDNNTVTMTNAETGKDVTVKLNDYEMMIFNIAMKEDEYVKSDENVYPYFETEYLFKCFDFGRNIKREDFRIGQQSIRDKIRKFQNDTGLKFATSTTIKISGDIYRLFEERGYDTEYEHGDVIAYIDKYDLSYNYVNFYENLKVLQDKYKKELEVHNE